MCCWIPPCGYNCTETFIDTSFFYLIWKATYYLQQLNILFRFSALNNYGYLLHCYIFSIFLKLALRLQKCYLSIKSFSAVQPLKKEFTVWLFNSLHAGALIWFKKPELANNFWQRPLSAMAEASENALLLSSIEIPEKFNRSNQMQRSFRVLLDSFLYK